MLRNRLVCGVNDERIQPRLLAESQLEFKKAMELAIAIETGPKVKIHVDPGVRQRQDLKT